MSAMVLSDSEDEDVVEAMGPLISVLEVDDIKMLPTLRCSTREMGLNLAYRLVLRD